ncbi:MAG: NUDIX hydrolase [Rhodanobacteraceae bacterium]
MVSVVAIRPDADGERVLLLQRAGEYLHGAWTYAAGHIEVDETGSQAARRELFEETGLVAERLYATSFCEQFYAPADDCIEVVPAFVAMVAPDGKVRLNGEHSAFRWLTFASARELLPFGSQRELFAHVQREFVDRPPCESLRVAAD